MHWLLYIMFIVIITALVVIFLTNKSTKTNNKNASKNHSEVILTRMELYRIINDPIPDWIVPKSKAVHLINEAERYMSKRLFPEFCKSIVVGLKAEIDQNINTPKDKLAKIYFLSNYNLYICGNIDSKLHSHNGVLCGMDAKSVLESEEMKVLMSDIIDTDELNEYENDVLYIAKRNRFWLNRTKNGGYQQCCHIYTDYYQDIYRSIINSKLKKAQSIESMKNVINIIGDDASFIVILSEECKRLGVDI